MPKKKQSGSKLGGEISAEEAQKDKFAFAVAKLAWKDGLSPNHIVTRMKLRHSPENINQVKRALKRALTKNFIRLFPPTDEIIVKELEEQYGKNQFTLLCVEIDFDATCLAMARIIAEKISELLAKNLNGPIYVANAGGGTIRDIVNVLEREVSDPPPEAKDRLTFVSLNSAEHMSRFDECANYISVRMAQIYGAKHRAIAGHGRTKENSHQEITDKEIHLLISSAGGAGKSADGTGKEGFLAGALKSRGLSLPDDIVGDIAFMPVDASGHQAKLPEDVESFIRSEIAPTPGFSNLVHYAATNRLLLVLTGDQKGRVGHALISSGLARQCVINLPVAKAILKSVPLPPQVSSRQ